MTYSWDELRKGQFRMEILDVPPFIRTAPEYSFRVDEKYNVRNIGTINVSKSDRTATVAAKMGDD